MDMVFNVSCIWGILIFFKHTIDVLDIRLSSLFTKHTGGTDEAFWVTFTRLTYNYYWPDGLKAQGTSSEFMGKTFQAAQLTRNI